MYEKISNMQIKYDFLHKIFLKIIIPLFKNKMFNYYINLAYFLEKFFQSMQLRFAEDLIKIVKTMLQVNFKFMFFYNCFLRKNEKCF